MTTIYVSKDCPDVQEYLEGIANEGTELEYYVRMTAEQKETLAEHMIGTEAISTVKSVQYGQVTFNIETT